jgi:Putative zinc-finger
MADHLPACVDWQEDLAGWLVAQLPPEREVALDAHVATCAACRTEQERLLAVAAVTLVGDPFGAERAVTVAPSPGLGDRIVAQVSAERRARRRVGASFALVGVAAVALVAIIATRPNPTPPLRGQAVAFAVQPSGVDASAVVARDGAGSLVELTASGLDPATTYALWLTPPDGGYAERVAAGTFRPNARGEVDERLHSALPASEMGRVWVTDPDGDITLDTQAD